MLDRELTSFYACFQRGEESENFGGKVEQGPKKERKEKKGRKKERKKEGKKHSQ